MRNTLREAEGTLSASAATLAAVLWFAATTGGVVLAQPAPATAPTTTATATAAAADGDEVAEADRSDQAVPRPADLAAVEAAVARLRQVRLAGEMVLEVDAVGDQRRESVPFVSLIETPERFRFEVPGELLVVRGESLFVYFVKQESYLAYDADALAEEPGLPEPVRAVLRQYEPLLLLVVDGRTVPEVLAGGKKADADASLESAGWPPAFVIGPEGHVASAFRNLKPFLEGEGVPRVDRAAVRFTYAAPELLGQTPEDAFAWSSPRGATRLNPVRELLEQTPAPAK